MFLSSSSSSSSSLLYISSLAFGFSSVFGLGKSTYVEASRILYGIAGDAQERSAAFLPPDSLIYSGI